MGMKYAGALFLIVTTSILGIAMAGNTTKCTNHNSSSSSGSGTSWSSSWCSGTGGANNDTHHQQQGPKTIVVNWDTSFQYGVWASQNPVIFENDILAFKYADNYTVYSMPNGYSCDFGTEAGAILIAGKTAGAGDGFQFVLKPKGPSVEPNYYFACKQFCQQGMSLRVFPMHRY